MRAIRGPIAVIAATAILTTGLLLAVTSASGGSFGAGPATDQLIREGQVVEISDTTITIHEWAGKYTYGLSPTGRQSLEANQIRPGDKVRFNVWAVWEIAYYFKKM
jgi:hypothetical protein